MIKQNICLICESQIYNRVSASIAPFVQARCSLSIPNESLSRLYCSSCDFSFYDNRLTDVETHDLYRNYRELEYNLLRQKMEPNFCDCMSIYNDHKNDYHTSRIRQIATMFNDWGVKPSRILDYGGEADAWLTHGIFPNSSIHNYDISTHHEYPLCEAYDLVFCSHVLEHVSFPLPLVKQLYSFLQSGGYIYIEVPLEGNDPLAETMIEGHPFNRMHEHVSFFSPKSLRQLLLISGFELLRLRIMQNAYFRSCCVLARKPATDNRAAPLSNDYCIKEEKEVSPPQIMYNQFAHFERLASQWIDNSPRIMLYPAGAYTMEILAFTSMKKTNIVAIGDSNAHLHGKKLMGKLVVGPESIPDLNVSIVLITSLTHEDAILQQLSWLRNFGVTLLPSSSIKFPKT